MAEPLPSPRKPVNYIPFSAELINNLYACITNFCNRRHPCLVMVAENSKKRPHRLQSSDLPCVCVATARPLLYGLLTDLRAGYARGCIAILKAFVYNRTMTLNIDNTAVKRINELREQQGKSALKLRITVDGGGCSGFMYKMELTDKAGKDDTVFADAVVTDAISLPFLAGSTVRFDQGLIGSEFKIENPNAVSGCGCGTSFSVV
jgi:iron-sulfur cluster insertion protein